MSVVVNSSSNPGKIDKVDFVGSVTSLAHYLHADATTDSANYLLWSNGGVLHWYNQLTVQQGQTRVFESAYIHGIKAVPQQQRVVVFGNKAVAVLSLSSSGQFKVEYTHESFDDLVLDVILVHSDAVEAKLLIGFAHNFYDEVIVPFGQSSGQFRMQHRHACPDNAVLFSLSFDNQTLIHNDVVLLVTGDVFGKLTLWRKKLTLAGSSFSTDASYVGKISKGEILATSHLHEGVIFRVVWNSYDIQTHQRQLLTVSDDRTLRLWNLNHDVDTDMFAFEQVFVAWGHISRLWDAAFLQSPLSSSSSDALIASCSEDGTIKLWNKAGKCVSTCIGHNGNVWRIIPLYYQHRNSNASTVQVVSCGNDGAVKFWDVDFQVQNSPSNESSTINVWGFPAAAAPEEPAVEVEVEDNHPAEESTEVIVDGEGDGEGEGVVQKKKKARKPGNGGNRRQNAVSAMAIAPCQSMMVIVSVTGQVWFVQVDHDTTRNSKGLSDYVLPTGFVARQWSAVLDIQQVVIEAHATITAHPQHAHQALINIAVFTVDGMIRYFSITTVYGSTEGDILHAVNSVQPWSAHRMKTVNLWMLDIASSSFSSSPALQEDKGRYLLTATVQGECKLWRYQEGQVDMQLVCILVTGKREIATSCLLYYPVAAEKDLAYLVIGDSRGGVNFYAWSAVTKQSTEPLALSPTQYFAFVHKHDPVSILAAYGEGCLLSAGHDNSMSFFALQTIPAGDHQAMQRLWTFENSVSTLPIHTPDQVFVSLSEDVGTASIYLTGYHGSSFLVYDIRRSYQLMRIEAGGWKRVHHCQVQHGDNNRLPSIFFACAAPLGKKDTELQCCGMQTPRPHLNKGVKSLDTWPLQLSVTSSDLVSNCATIIRYPVSSAQDKTVQYHSLVAVGGEECFMKVYQLPDMSLRQETTLSKNASLKSLTTANCLPVVDSSSLTQAEKLDREATGIVVGAGGKLLFYIWTYDFRTAQHHKNAVMPLRKVHAGSIVPNASQDHRILSANTVYLGRNNQDEHSYDHFLVLLADSRGFITIVDFKYNFSVAHNVNSLDRQFSNQQFDVQVRYQVEVSLCPLLSSSLLYLPSFTQEAAVFAVGDTRGNVLTMLLPMAVEEADVGYSRKLLQPYLLSEYTAHAMGTNSLTMKALPASSSGLQHVMIASGGDDQSMSFYHIQLQLKSEDGKLFVSRESSPLLNKTGAAGTAMKGSSILDITMVSENAFVAKVASVAYDQRFSVWNVSGTMQVVEESALVFKEAPRTTVLQTKDTLPSLFESHESMLSRVGMAWGLEWDCGVITHTMEVSNLAFNMLPSEGSEKEVEVVIAGQGFQHLHLTL